MLFHDYTNQLINARNVLCIYKLYIQYNIRMSNENGILLLLLLLLLFLFYKYINIIYA